MTNENLRNTVRDSQVASQLVKQLPGLPSGSHKITVTGTNERSQTLRVVRLSRQGNKLITPKASGNVGSRKPAN